MKIILEFRVYPRFLDGLDHEVEAIFEDAPYVPKDWWGLCIKWDDFYEQETSEIIYRSISEGLLTPSKTLEQFEKDKIIVKYEFMPHFTDDELYEMGTFDDDFEEDDENHLLN